MNKDWLVKQVISWLEEYNPFEDEGLYSSNIIDLWLVGSRAKGTNKENSDYDVAVIFPSCLKIENSIEETSLKLTEKMHISFGFFMPQYKNCDIDIQIFFDDDLELKTYSKIELLSKKKVYKL